MKLGYIRAMKKWMVLLEMRDPKNDYSFVQKRIRVIREQKIVPYKATI